MILQYKPLVVSLQRIQFLEFIGTNNHWLLRDVTGMTPLHTAVDMGQIELARDIIKTNPDTLKALSYKGETPLHIACLIGDVEMVVMLLEAGADTTARTLCSATPEQYTISKEVIELFKRIGIDSDKISA